MKQMMYTNKQDKTKQKQTDQEKDNFVHQIDHNNHKIHRTFDHYEYIAHHDMRIHNFGNQVLKLQFIMH